MHLLAMCQSACRSADAALGMICEGKTFSYASCNQFGSWEHFLVNPK
jgi:hypothetical protein